MKTYLSQVAEDIRTNLPSDADEPAEEPDLFLLYALLALTKGENVTLEDVHDAWMAWMTMRGEEHRSMVPFGKLAPDVQREDAPYLAAIQAAVRERSRRSRS